MKGRETVRAELGIQEFPLESWELVGEIKERQLESSVKSRLKSRNASFTCSFALSACFPRFVADIISLAEGQIRRGCFPILLHLPPNKRDTNRANYTRHLLLPRGESSLRVLAVTEERAEGWKRHLASVPPLSLVNFTSLGWVITASIAVITAGSLRRCGIISECPKFAFLCSWRGIVAVYGGTIGSTGILYSCSVSGKDDSYIIFVKFVGKFRYNVRSKKLSYSEIYVSILK